ncbi:hypothetical protein FWC63_03225 [Candidatus Saccharibacteria bacterium]|nr:hypothetical protein [Candidatus Saccharibacteria bacterium]
MSMERRTAGGADRQAADRVSAEEQKLFNQKFDIITEIIGRDQISIKDFQVNPPSANDFILDEYAFGRAHTFHTPQERMHNDIRSEQRVLERINQTPATKTAVALEYIFGVGVKAGNWLGTRADTRATSTFDDTRYKIDEIVTIENEDEETPPFGIDVTTSSNPEIVRDKLERSHNNKALDLPSGCSRLIYYENEEERRSLPLVPRYVISISSGFVESIVRSNVHAGKGGLAINQHSPAMLNIRHRILSELSAQADLRLNQISLTPPQEQTDTEADAIDFIGLQKDMFDTALSEVEALCQESSPSLQGLPAGKLRQALIDRQKSSDTAYKTLMNEIASMNEEVKSQKRGQKISAIAS